MKLASRVALLLLLVASSALAQEIPASEYKARRERVARAIGPNAMLILTSPPPAERNGDVTYPFRQDDNLLYLTGITQSNTSLVIIPSEDKYREVLFVDEANPSREVWTGRLMKPDEVKARSGVAQVVGSGMFRPFVEAALSGSPFGNEEMTRYFRGASMPAFRELVRGGRAEVWVPLRQRGATEIDAPRELRMVTELRRRYPELAVRNATPLLVAMREVKSPAEIALIQKAIDITADAHKAAMKRILTATNERQVHATIEHAFLEGGADGWGFPSVVGAGVNATTLHYDANDAPIARDALLVADIGAEVHGYTADVTRTFPADGTFSDFQREIYQAVLTAQNEVMPLMRPGSSWREIHTKATDTLGRELAKLGLISENVPAQTRLYFMHGLGHPLGLQVHDVFDPDRKLEEGMVVTNEPGIYVRPDDVTGSEVFRKLTPEQQEKIRRALDRYRGIGVRIEDDVLVTATGPKLLSAGSPRTIEEIERWMAAAAR
ncbi:MAG TPA: aminopeptidase P family protein [Thermoanaerobaculia bacterium]|nr:aminopeptidase P family protein [Thermoanaerobaculia bacterium]